MRRRLLTPVTEKGKIMPTIVERIMNTDKVICRHLDKVDGESRGVVSQDILSHLIDFVEHIMLKFYSGSMEIEDSEENIRNAIEYTQTNHELKQLYRFHKFLQTVSIHYTLDENNSERLMLKYFRYLIEIKKIVKDYLCIQVLHNLSKFPLNLDTSLQEYYTKISEKVNKYTYRADCDNNRYYIEKIKSFFVGEEIYYEVTFTLAIDWHNKTNRIVAFTKYKIPDDYAVKFHLISETIRILDTTMPISIIDGWEISIRDCEYSNFISLITGQRLKVPFKEQTAICKFLTHTGYSLCEVMDFPDNIYNRLTSDWRNQAGTEVFIHILDICRQLISEGGAGKNIIRYLLHNMDNAVIKKQWYNSQNSSISNLYLQYGCLPFEEMPYFNALLGHPPRQYDVFECIPAYNRHHEMLARKIKNNTEMRGSLFTDLSEVERFGDIEELVQKFKDSLYWKHREQNKLVIENGHIFINHYKDDTCTIIKVLQELSDSGIPDFSRDVQKWLNSGVHEVDCDEKKVILSQIFADSKVAIIYGSAGVGKSTLINHIAHYFENEKKLFLAHTNPAKCNLERRINSNDDNNTFSTIASFLLKSYLQNEYDLLVIDECSTVSNEDMVEVLKKAKFKYLVLVGDTYQIDSIQFGNWFTAVQNFISPHSVFELTEPHRAKENKPLLNLWASVRKMEDDTQGLINKQSLSLDVDTTLLTTIEKNECILCLNYDGLYGINNINRFLQQSNPNPAYRWGIQSYKVDDPVLFHESNRFTPVIYNNMKGIIKGIKILDSDTADERIQFDIELEERIDEDDAGWYGLNVLPDSEHGNMIVRFCVHKTKSTDEDDDTNTSRTIVPFQLAYAVSIHKSQGLEYDSVKIVITDEVDELITHSIFYTAITRARKSLRIYWTAEVEAKVITRIKPRDISRDVKLLRYYIKQN